MEKVNVFQDGSRFYADSDSRSYMAGVVIFESAIVVKDFDTHAAELARDEFVLWAMQNNIDWMFV